MFKIIANTAAALSLASTVIETGSKGFKRASKGAQTAVAINDIKNYTGDSLLNTSSEKHNSMKAAVRKFDNVGTTFHKAKGAVGGFFDGCTDALKNNLSTVGSSILTLASKKKPIKMAGMVGLGISLAWDFLKNGTNLFTKKDYIEK